MADRTLSRALFADLYELTMAQAYWQHDRRGTATFSLFFRSYPPDRAYAVFAGLESALAYAEGLRFTSGDVDYLRSLGTFDADFLTFLGDLRFTGDVRAMTEGDLAFADEPVLEVTGPIIEAQLVETAVMNAVSTETLLATKASRVLHAAQGRAVVDFAARRTHGEDAADKLARVCYLVGFAGTSNVLGAARHGIPPVGTMAHSFISSFPAEIDAFRAYADSFPDTTTLLVDTYDTVVGTRHAIDVAKELRAKGHELRALRLDSGDLLALSIECRRLLDDAGLREVELFASGGLDEFEIDVLVRAGAPIDGFGVGTKLGVSADAPWMDWAYKLVEHAGAPVLKLSADKETLAARKQVYRIGATAYERDVIALADEAPPAGAQALLREVMRGGKRTEDAPSLTALRERFAAEFARLPDAHKALRSPEQYTVEHSSALDDLQWRVTEWVAQHELGRGGEILRSAQDDGLKRTEGS